MTERPHLKDAKSVRGSGSSCLHLCAAASEFVAVFLSLHGLCVHVPGSAGRPRIPMPADVGSYVDHEPLCTMVLRMQESDRERHIQEIQKVEPH